VKSSVGAPGAYSLVLASRKRLLSKDRIDCSTDARADAA
jgi:hypothetical protein